MSNSMRWLHEPLFHFFVLGAVLFILFGWLNRDGFQGPNEIVVDGERVAAIEAQFTRTWQRSPTDEELSRLIDAWVREEVFYREGMALGLDQEDPLVRQRVTLKMRFMADSLVSDEFSTPELVAYLMDNAERYRIDAEYAFRQVYFDPRKHGDNLANALSGALQSLDASPDTITGDSTLLPASMQNASTSEISNLFGSAFAAALESLPAGEWAGPVESAYGAHFVYIEDLVPARHPDIEEVRDSVERDLLAQRTGQAEESLYEMLRERYTVRFSEDSGIGRDKQSAPGTGG